MEINGNFGYNPKATIPILEFESEVFKFKDGAISALSQNTDYLRIDSAQYGEMMAYKHDIRPTGYISISESSMPYIDFSDRSIFDFGTYYFETTSTNTKTEAEILADAQVEIDFFKGLTGRKPVTLSYKQGFTSQKDTLKQRYLHGRNSNIDNLLYDVEFTDLNSEISRASVNRSYTRDKQTTHALALVEQATLINNTIANEGWYNDFFHYHFLKNDNVLNYIDDYYSNYNTTIGSSDVWRCGMGEMVSYSWIRSLINSVTVQDFGGFLKVTIDKTTLGDTYLDSLLNESVSIKVDTSTTTIAGNEISSTAESELKKGTDLFSIEVSDFSKPIYVYPTATPTYKDNNKPSLISDDGLNLVFDREVSITVFSKPTGANDDSFTVLDRRDYATTHAVNRVGADFKVGAITRNKRSILI